MALVELGARALPRDYRLRKNDPFVALLAFVGCNPWSQVAAGRRRERANWPNDDFYVCFPYTILKLV
jgi:hypothetical protein